MIDFQIGTTVGYVLLAIFIAWSLITTKGRYVYKCIGIFVLIYYVLIVYFSQSNIMGWPVKKDLPANAKIISVRVIEPNDNHEGGMWFWLNEKPHFEEDLFNMVQPNKMFTYTGGVQPRSYKIPYDRELHKKLFEKQKQSGKGGCFLATGKKGVKRNQGEQGEEDKKEPPSTGEKGVKRNQGEQGEEDKKEPPFEIINPIELFKKG